MSSKKLQLLIGLLVLSGSLLANSPRFTFDKNRNPQRKTNKQEISLLNGNTFGQGSTNYQNEVTTAKMEVFALSSVSKKSQSIVTIAHNNQSSFSNGGGGASAPVTFGSNVGLRKSGDTPLGDLQKIDATPFNDLIGGVTDLFNDEEGQIYRLPDDPDDPGIIDVPVGEGLWILLLLVGGYAAVKRRKE